MRVARVLVVLVLCSSAFGSGALGAQSKTKGEAPAKASSAIQPTGIESFDSVFDRVGAIDGQLSSAEAELRSGKRNLNTALGLEKGTPLSDGIAELQKRAQGKLQLTLKGNVPKLSPTDAIPSNVQDAVDAVNGLTEDMSSSVTDLTALQPEISDLVTQATDLPSHLKEEFSGGSANLFETLFQLPKTSKALKNDVDVTLGLPDRAADLTGRMTDLLDLVSTSFGGPSVGPHPSGHPNGGHPTHPASGEKKKPPAR